MSVKVHGYRGETRHRILTITEDVTLTQGGYEPGTLVALRDPDGRTIARMTAEGWESDKDGGGRYCWDDIVIEADR